MNGSHFASAVDNMAARFYKDRPTTVASLQEVLPVSPKLGRAMVTLAGKVSSRVEALRAVSQAIAGVAAPIENSFMDMEIPNALTPVYMGWIRRNPEIKVINNKAEMAHFKVMASNLLMNPEDESLWELRASDKNKFLVRRDNEDLSELMEQASASRSLPKMLDRITAAAVQPLEFASFIDDERGSVRFGPIISVLGDNVRILPIDTRQDEVISADLIVASMDANTDMKTLGIKAPNAETPADDMVAYYQKVFGYAPQFMNELRDIILDRTSF